MPVTTLSPPSDATRTGLVRAERRLADARHEFDAALSAGRPMATLVACDHEVRLATAALAAVRGVTVFPTSGWTAAV